MTLTKEWLLKTIAELEEERDAIPGAVNEDAAMALSAMKLALTSLNAELVAMRDERSGSGGVSKLPGFNDLPHGTRLYTAPPAPVVPDAISTRQAISKMEEYALCDSVNVAFKYGWNACAFKYGWNACRDAMFQGAEPVKTAYKLREGVAAIRNSGIAIDAEKIQAERDALNSPAIPDGWKLVPVELTGAMTNAMTDAILDDLHNVDVWRSVLAAAPQQEAE